MNPTKRKEISKLAAEKLGRDFTQVDEIAAFFFRHVQKRLSAIEHVAVNVPNLGTFVLKKKRVENKLEKYKNYIKLVDETESIRAFENKQLAKKDIEKFEAALQLMQQEEERKLQVRTLQRNQDAD